MSTRTLVLLLGITVALVVAVVAIPVFLIMPFKSQTPEMVTLSHALRRWSPVATAVGLVVGLVLVVRLWPGRRPWQRGLAVLALAPLVGAAWFARQNHFEWMFAPLPGVDRVAASQATFVEPGDMVLGIVVNGVPMAYPVNQVAYHHVVNDTVGGVPIAATY